jgi:hypothetical protein
MFLAEWSDHLWLEVNVFVNYHLFCARISATVPIPVAERSKEWVCSRSPAGIARSNPAEGMDACLL